MNTSAMHGLAIGLLISFGLVIGVAATFAAAYRRHLPRPGRPMDPLAPLVGARRRPLAFPMPHRWLAIRGVNTPLVRETLGLAPEPGPSWAEALARHRERSFFVSPPVDGWTLVVGAAIPDPAHDVDDSFRFLLGLSRALGEVHAYGADRVLNFHGWACLRDGRVSRAYVWAGETLWNEGPTTLDERLLGLRCREYFEEPEPPRYGTAPPEQHNAERVVLLARRWSLDPVAASEALIQQETAAQRGDPDDRA